MWVFLTHLFKPFIRQETEKQYHGMTLPLKRLPRWTFDIPLAQHHRSTSPHISFCSSDNTMWLDQNSPLHWLCWPTLPPITHRPLWSKITPECIWDMKYYPLSNVQNNKSCKPLLLSFLLSVIHHKLPLQWPDNQTQLSITQQVWLTRISCVIIISEISALMVTLTVTHIL